MKKQTESQPNILIGVLVSVVNILKSIEFSLSHDMISLFREGNVELKKSLEFLVIDEADLIFTFGFQNDVKYILENSPHIYQVIYVLKQQFNCSQNITYHLRNKFSH